MTMIPKVDQQMPPTEPGREPITLTRDDVYTLLDAAGEKRERMQDDFDRGIAYDKRDLAEYDALLKNVEAALGYPR